MFFKDRCPVNNIIGIPAKVDDLSQEGGAEHCEDEAEWGLGSEEDGVRYNFWIPRSRSIWVNLNRGKKLC